MSTTTERLKEVFEEYEGLKAICDLAKERAKRDPKFALKIIPLSSSKPSRKNKSQIIDKYFDNLYKNIESHYVLELITLFEKLLFNKFENTYGIIKNIVSQAGEQQQKSGSSFPLNRAITLFIKNKEDIYSLAGAKTILKKQIKTKEMYEYFLEIIDHRNWLSHGKRADVGKESLLKIEEIYDILVKIADEL